MTISRGDDGFECMCDYCYSLMETTAATFNAMIQIVLASNWVPEKDEDTGDWNHRCPDCIPKWDSPLERAKRMFGSE